MAPGLYVLMAIGGLLLFFGLLVAAMNVAFAKEKKYIKIQTYLLARMAHKQGIDDEEIRRFSRTERLPNII